jgi:hypothetical protein
MLRAGFLDWTEFRGLSIFPMSASKLALHSSGNNGAGAATQSAGNMLLDGLEWNEPSQTLDEMEDGRIP